MGGKPTDPGAATVNPRSAVLPVEVGAGVVVVAEEVGTEQLRTTKREAKVGNSVGLH